MSYPFFMDIQRPIKLTNQHFGLEVKPADFSILAELQGMHYVRPWRNLQAYRQDKGSNLKKDKDSFRVNLDVQHFGPDEITVKISDGYLVIEASHDEKGDEHGLITRSFKRRYLLPKDVKQDLVESKLSSDGVLSVVAHLKIPENETNEKIIPIIKTGPISENEEEDVITK